MITSGIVRSSGLGNKFNNRRRGFPENRVKAVMMRLSRRPAWRWDLASEIVESGLRAPRTSLDPALANIVRFQRSYERSISPEEFSAIERRQPGLFRACMIYLQYDLTRWRLEARLLANQPVNEVAEAEGLSTETVAAYESAFFDVRTRLNAKLWVFALAIGPHYHQRLEAHDAGVVLKAFAYVCGSQMLDLLLATIVNEEGHLLPVDLSRLDTTEGRLAARAQLTVAAMTGCAEAKQLAELVRIQLLIAAADRAFAVKSATAAAIPADFLSSLTNPAAETSRQAPTSAQPTGVQQGRQTPRSNDLGEDEEAA